MFKLIIAYGLCLIIGPTLSGLAYFLFAMVKVNFFARALPFKILKTILFKFFFSFFSAAFSSLTYVWVGVKIFHWLDQEPGILMLVLMLISVLQNDVARLYNKIDKEFETFSLIGDVFGFIVAGYVFNLI